MHILIDLIQAYGYVIIFIGTILEGETVVVLGGFSAFEGYLYLPYVVAVGIIGSIIGDQAFFHFGRWKGRGFLEKRPNWHARAAYVHRLVERHQNLVIFGSRFMYGFRSFLPVILGTSKVSSLRFFLLNFLGAAVWTSLFAYGGYAFGHAVRRFLGDVHKIEGYILLGIIIVVTFVQVISWWVGKKEESILEKEEEKTHTKEQVNGLS